MKCSLSHARLRACAARDGGPPLGVARRHGRYGRARDGGPRGAAVESGAAAVVLQQRQREDTETARRHRERPLGSRVTAGRGPCIGGGAESELQTWGQHQRVEPRAARAELALKVVGAGEGSVAREGRW